MILERLEVAPDEFERRTGWAIKSQEACKDARCVPLPPGSATPERVDVHAVAERLGMPIVHNEAHGLWSFGPESGGRFLESAQAPELTLPDWRGGDFRLSSLRRMKVLLLAWASW